jgi:Leucine Rich Repeat (LRR) protein
MIDLQKNIKLKKFNSSSNAYQRGIRDKIWCLKLKGKGISSLSQLTNLHSLLHIQHIDLSKNELSNLDGLPPLMDLISIDLSNNNFDRIPNFENAPNLKVLILNSNNLSSIDEFAYLHNLQILQLAKNKIFRINGMGNLNQLKDFRIDSNPIADLIDKKYGLRDFMTFTKNIKQMITDAKLGGFELDGTDKTQFGNQQSSKCNVFAENKGIFPPKLNQKPLQPYTSYPDEIKRKLKILFNVTNRLTAKDLSELLNFDRKDIIHNFINKIQSFIDNSIAELIL